MSVRLEMREISKHFIGVQALAGVSLSVDAGQILALVGENGAGKSTLIKTLSGALVPDSGEILIDGKPVRFHNPRDSEPYGIATIYQELNLFPDLTVAENLLFGRYPKSAWGGIDWKAARVEAERFLGQLGVHVDASERVRDLSVAQRQMLEIAKALHREVQILILDEPTAVLGGADVDNLIALVTSLRDRGVAVIFISHRLSEIFGFADHYAVLRDGRLTGAGLVEDIDEDQLVSMMVGRELGFLAKSGRREVGEVVLEAEGLTRHGVLTDIDLTLHRGEVLGVAGLRGSGRTELARALFGADPIDAGRVTVNGRVMIAKSPSQAVRAGMGLVPEDRGSQGLFRALSTAANIPIVRMAATNARLASPSEDRRLAEAYVDKLSIRLPDVGVPVATLSGGNQQKVVLAKWLEADVSVLILDEPTRGIDVGAKRAIYDIVDSLCDSGVGVILISSELPEVLAMSQWILVMHQGRVEAELDRDEATEEIVMRYAVGAGDSHES